MNQRYLVLDRDDFGRPITLSWATDLMDSFAEADDDATLSIEEGSKETYVFKLEKIYLPRGKERHVEEVYVEAKPSAYAHYEGHLYGGTD